MKQKILVAGATGNLGGRIIKALLERDAEVYALVRKGSDDKKLEKLKLPGVKIIEANLFNLKELREACRDVSCVVSALQGLHEIIVELQDILLDAAIEAGAPRFIPSDFSSDFTKLPKGENRNFDLRRDFHEILDKASIAPTSIFNGAFAEILTYNIPVLNFKDKSVGYWGDDPDYKLDFTTMDNTAAFTASAALDEAAPRSLHISSFKISPSELVTVASDVFGASFRLVGMGSIAELTAQNKQMRAADPEGEKELYPRWQSSQYIQSMFSVQNKELDNDKYPGINWTSAKEIISGITKR